MKVLMILGLVLFQVHTEVKEDGPPVTLEYCYQQLEENYPTVDKIELQKKITELNKKIADTGLYPDVTFSGMASYQSDVTEVTFTPPGTAGPEFSKDHYKIGLDITQPIYNGGLINTRRALEEVSGEQERHAIEVQLHRLKEQLNGVFFGVLLYQQKLESVGVLLSDLRQQLQTTKVSVENGVLLPSQVSILRAEILKVEQDSIRIAADKKAARKVLELLIDKELEEDAILQVPEYSNSGMAVTMPGLRPEYRVFDSSRQLLEEQSSLSHASKVPSLSAFATTAYGRPGLDVFNDDLQAYYIFGLRLQWNFRDAFNAGREQEILRHRRKLIDADEEAFNRQLKSSLSELEEKMLALREVINKDEDIIELTHQVVEESSTRLNKGVITATEYMSELTRLHKARLNKTLHELELVKARIEYKTKLGEPLK